MRVYVSWLDPESPIGESDPCDIKADTTCKTDLDWQCAKCLKCVCEGTACEAKHAKECVVKMSDEESVASAAGALSNLASGSPPQLFRFVRLFLYVSVYISLYISFSS